MFRPTEIGEQIAAESGLADYAKVVEGDYKETSLTKALAHNESMTNMFVEEAVEVARAQARTKLRSFEEVAEHERGLSISESGMSWRYLNDQESRDTLFPIESFDVLAGSREEVDDLVMSGVLGLEFSARKAVRGLFTSAGMERFGFQNKVQVARFVGGYLLGALNQEYYRETWAAPASYVYREGGIHHEISCIGDLHGDFRMVQRRYTKGIVISPINTREHFGPVEQMVVAGYHSVEPSLVENVIEDVFLRQGKEGALLFLDEVEALIEERFADSDGEIPFKKGNFADYGDGGIDFNLVKLELMVQDSEFLTAVSTRELLDQHLAHPGSKEMLVVERKWDGLMFRNGSEHHTDTRGIMVHVGHYPEFLSLLISQAQQGRGRTAPDQIVDLLKGARQILDGKIL